MVEELHRDSISDQTRATTDIEQAFRGAQQLEEREVFDVNGVHVGRITRCFADDDGRLDRCEVTLDRATSAALGASARTALVEPEWIADVRNDGVHLSRAGEQVVGDGTPVHASRDTRGAPERPRKER